MAMIAAGELHDDIAAGEPAGQADRAHRRFGAARNEPHHFDRRHGIDDHLREFGFEFGRGAEAGAILKCLIVASTTAGWAWPRIIGPQEPMKSR